MQVVVQAEDPDVPVDGLRLVLAEGPQPEQAVHLKADEEVLDEKGKVDVTKTRALIFDQFRSGYYVTGEKVGQAWNAGKDINLKK